MRHLLAAALLAALAVGGSWPLAARLGRAVPGEGAGDNLAFLWNLWWARAAAEAPGESLLFTRHLLHPDGAELVLHTHTASYGLVARTLLAGLSPLAALGVLVLLALFLNGLGAYALAWDLTRRPGPALLAGALYGASPFVAAHLRGHFNLVSAWILPLFALPWGRAIARDAPGWGAAAGLVLAAGLWTDYNLALYAALLGVVLVLARCFAIEVTTERRPWSRAVLALLALDLVAMALIAASGGTVIELAGVRVSLRGTVNLRSAAWVLGAVLFVHRLRPRARLTVTGSLPARVAIVTALVTVAAASPILLRGIALAASGDYSTQAYSWRNAPPGIDLAALVIGNPRHPLWGAPVARLHARLGFDAIEHAAYLGAVPLALLCLWRSGARCPAARPWWLAGLLFLLWALGPRLHLLGWDSGLLLPATVVRWLPVVSNARIPARAMVVVFLALAMLVALAVAERRPPRRLLAALFALALLDQWSAPLALFEPARPALYTRLAAAPGRGAVCELPLGLADGFGSLGRFERIALFHQTLHGRPMTGGFLARLPRRVLAEAAADPLLGPLLAASEGRPVDADARVRLRATFRASVRRLDIAWFVLDRAAAPPALVELVERDLPLRRVSRDGARDLYRATGTGDDAHSD